MKAMGSEIVIPQFNFSAKIEQISTLK